MQAPLPRRQQRKKRDAESASITTIKAKIVVPAVYQALRVSQALHNLVHLILPIAQGDRSYFYLWFAHGKPEALRGLS